MKHKASPDGLRMPPSAIEAEQSVLGGLMLGGAEAFARIDGRIEADDFYRKDHRLIFTAIADLVAKGKPFDAVTMADWLAGQGAIELAGGPNYVIDLANNTPSAANVSAYADIVLEKAELRRLIDHGTSMVGEAFAGKKSASDIAAAATHELLQVSGRGHLAEAVSAKQVAKEWFADLHRRYEQREEYSGLRSPWKVVDDVTAGWQPGDLIIVAGRPSMGKSVFGFQAAGHAALRENARTMVFSMEMRRSQFLQRAVACFGGVEHEHLRKPVLMPESDWPRVTNAMTMISASPLVIDDSTALTGGQVAARARREHMRSPLKLAIVDHLHEMGRPMKNEPSELADNTRALKRMARDLGIPVILLVQLNRGNLARSDKRPNLGDLRGSGAIEEIADVVLLLHREEYYDPGTHLKGVVEVILGKGRDLPAGSTLHLEAQLRQMRMAEWEGSLPLPMSAPKSKKATFGDDGDARELPPHDWRQVGSDR